MDNYLAVGIFSILFTTYWWLLSILVSFILESPRLRLWNWLVIGVLNTAVVLGAAVLFNSAPLCYCIMMLLMFVELYLFHKDSFVGVLLCTLACAIHIAGISMITVGVFSLVTSKAPYEIITNSNSFVWCAVAVFLLLDLAIAGILKIFPLTKVKLINQHNEQRWFINAWMAVGCVFLFFAASFYFSPSYPAQLVGNQIAASVVTMIGLYIILFFSIKTTSLLGYRDKNVKLEAEIQQEQQYRNFMIRDALIYYEANLTKDLIIKGSKEYGEAAQSSQNRYSDMLVLMSRKYIYSEDIAGFMQSCNRTNLLRLFEKGERETIVEYRRLLDTGEYVWVRAIINLAQDAASNDVNAFACAKNINDEKKNQIELQFLAERDALTGLFNRNTTAKLIDEHILFGYSATGAALFMIDVDNFKQINDSLGHVFGDAVLCELADKLKEIFRSTDIVGRAGGDEYIAFLKDGATLDLVNKKAEEICKAFHLTYQGSGVESFVISGSVGVSLFPLDGDKFIELYSKADVALYSAKGDGKNRYRVYDGSRFSAYTSERTEIQSNGSVLQKNFRENRIEYVFKMLYQSENPVTAIHSVLELMSRHFSFERGYIFQTSPDGKTTSNTFEWCAEGVSPEIHNLQKIPIEAVATANSNFFGSGTFVLKRLEDLEPIERAVLEPQGIKSMFQFGIFDKTRLLGFIGFDNCKSEIIPSETEIDEMKTICNILATFFVKQYIDECSQKDLLARQDVMNHIDNFIYVINTETFELLFMNEKIQKLMNGPGQKNHCYDFFRGNSSQCEDCPMKKMIRDGIDRSVSEIYNEKLNIWMETSASMMRWTDGSLACLITCTDITAERNEHKAHVDQLEQLIYVDTLTGKRTYQKFQLDAQKIIDSNPDTMWSLVKVDIANFKLINQIYGFEKGNQVLCCVAAAIEQTTRNENEIFARVNNDEFIALFAIKEVAEVNNLNRIFLYNFQQMVGSDFLFQCKFPHGRYIITPDDAKKMTVYDMFEKVNIAHKTAKLNKALDFVFYDEEMTNEALRVKEIENLMEEALKEEQFVVYLQPKYYLKDDSIGGAEALTRWNFKNGTPIPPSSFISIFEQNGFITKLDLYVFEKACQTIKEWITHGIEPVTISVNFSRLHLSNPNFVKSLCKIVDSKGIDRRYLEIEITETVIFDNLDTLEELLDEIHKNGFSMSMDDFGSGYSSLGMLKDFAVDTIKMDRSFFANQRDTERSKIVVNSIIQMAMSLGIRIVAEGVEEQEHIDFLRELKCDMVQGFFYAKPMPIDNFTKLLCEAAEMEK